VSSTDRRSVLRVLFALLIAVPGALTLVVGQTQSLAPRTQPLTVKLTPEEASRLAEEARASVSAETAPGLELKLWASGRLITDPIAIDLDPRGTLYATSSSRTSIPLDIRAHPTWVPEVHTLKTVEDLRKFYDRELASGRSAQNDWIPDLNKDGSHDQRDFTEVKERLQRIQDTNGDGLADFAQTMIEGFNDDPTYDVAGGLMYYEGDLFFGIAPGVWRLRDENGDGVIDKRIPFSEGYSIHPAFGGHGISGITMGPDGRIYWEVGDIGLDVVDKTGRRWSYPNQGAVMRANPDGSGFEVFAAGIRNLQEFSFDEHGNLISVDNDGDHEGETERLVYITDGSDSGWRSNWQYGKYTDPDNNRYNVWMDEGMYKPRFQGQAAHIVPPIAPHHAGPSGMVYNPGTALSDAWRKHFFVTSFPGTPSGARIYAFTLKEQGAGFALESEQVALKGILAVGMKFGPDGALYLTDWITGWEVKGDGRIWKLDAPEAAKSAVRAEVASLLSQDITSQEGVLVRRLLRHADMRVRQRAQFELVRRSDSQNLIAEARESPSQLSRIHALWGLGQLARKDPAQAAVLPGFLRDQDAEIRAQAIRMIGDARYAPAAEALVPLLKDSSARVRFFAAEALGRLRFKPAAAPLVEMLANNDDHDVYLRHAGSLALARIGDSAFLASLSKNPSRAVRIAAIVALRRMRSPEVARFLADSDEGVVTEAARAINDDGSIPDALPALARVLDQTWFSNEALLRRAIAANLRVGGDDAVARLASLAADRGRPEDARADAMGALGVWPSPSPLDRVDGMYVGPVAKRDATAARAAVLRLVESLRTERGTPLKVALANAAGKIGATEAAPVLLTELREESSPEVRLAALRALQALKAGDMDDIMRLALGDSDAGVRRAALRILPELPISDAARVQHISSILKNGTIQDKQGAIDVLGTLKSQEATQALGSLVDQLVAGKMAPEIQLDLASAVEANGAPPLQARLDAYRKAKGADSQLAAFRPALLRGGNAVRGREVFYENPATQCTRCHTVRGSGADVGPNLTSIGSSLSREQLVEALLEPNARIAPGYGLVSVTLRNGQKVEGTLREETPAELVVAVGTPPKLERISKKDVAKRSNPTSAMPPVGLILKPREVRDVVEFLSSLR
jgi:quinoprotein glucose dehydrogenase